MNHTLQRCTRTDTYGRAVVGVAADLRGVCRQGLFSTSQLDKQSQRTPGQVDHAASITARARPSHGSCGLWLQSERAHRCMQHEATAAGSVDTALLKASFLNQTHQDCSPRLADALPVRSSLQSPLVQVKELLSKTCYKDRLLPLLRAYRRSGSRELLQQGARSLSMILRAELKHCPLPAPES